MKISRSADATEVTSWASALAISLILFSPYTYAIFTLLGGYLFEVALFIVGLIVLLIPCRVNRALFIGAKRSLIPFLCISAFIGIIALIGIASYGKPFDSYADARANAFVVLGALIGGYLIRNRQSEVFVLAICTVGWSLVYWLQHYLLGGLGDKFPTPLFAGVVAALVSAERGHSAKFAIAICATLFLAVVSSFRQYWIVGALCLIVGTLQLFRSGKSFAPSKLAGIAFVVLSIYLASGFIWQFLNRNESSYIQSIGKTQDAIDWSNGGDPSDSDNLRMSYFVYMADRAQDLILPHGLGHAAQGDSFDKWFSKISPYTDTLDSVLLFIAYQYGYITLIPLVILFGLQSYRCNARRGWVRFGLLLAILLVPLLFDGGQVVVTIRAFWFGVFYAYLTKTTGVPKTAQVARALPVQARSLQTCS